jgi:hypothetical protein
VDASDGREAKGLQHRAALTLNIAISAPASDEYESRKRSAESRESIIGSPQRSTGPCRTFFMNSQAFAYYLETHPTRKNEGRATPSPERPSGQQGQPDDLRSGHAEAIRLAGVISADIARLVSLLMQDSKTI